MFGISIDSWWLMFHCLPPSPPKQARGPPDRQEWLMTDR
jgi:hypothetical protein